jgi:hypothetical protein
VLCGTRNSDRMLAQCADILIELMKSRIEQSSCFRIAKYGVGIS